MVDSLFALVVVRTKICNCETTKGGEGQDNEKKKIKILVGQVLLVILAVVKPLS